MGTADDDLPWAVAGPTIPPPNPPPTGRGPGPRHLPRWWPGVPLALAALIVAVLIQRGSASSTANRPDTAGSTSQPAGAMTIPPSTRWPTPSPTPTALPYSTSRSLIDAGQQSAILAITGSELTDRTSPTTTTLDMPLLNVSGNWELLGWGQGSLVRIQLTAGIIVRTPIPTLENDYGAQLLIGPNRAVIQSQGGTPGYTVPDGGPASALPYPLVQGGPMVPGPDLDHVWTTNQHNGTIDLVDWEGRPAGPRIALSPAGFMSMPVSDGAGYLLVDTVDGVYDATPDGLHRITTGMVVAIGPSGYLVRECDDEFRCGLVVIDRASGKRRTLPDAGLLPGYGITGVISPDGRAAAVLQPFYSGVPTSADGAQSMSPGQSTAVVLIDLETGESNSLSPPIDESLQAGTMVFSPDSHWLFVTGPGGLFAVGVADHGTFQLDHNLGGALPSLQVLAVRPAP